MFQFELSDPNGVRPSLAVIRDLVAFGDRRWLLCVTRSAPDPAPAPVLDHLSAEWCRVGAGFKSVCIMHCVRVLLLTLLVVAPVLCSTGTFFVLSDVHLDLFYSPSISPSNFCRNATLAQMYNITGPLNNGDCQTDDYDYDPDLDFTYGKYGCDSPAALVQWTLDAMYKVNPQPDFILLLGDLSAHCQINIDSTMDSVQQATQLVSNTFGNVTVLPVVGNNDVFPHNQLPLGPTEIMSNYAELWNHWLEPVATPGYEENFTLAGFYSASPVPGMRVISLNTLYYGVEWCTDNTTLCSPDEIASSQREDDPMGQFQWLESELVAAGEAGERVLIQSHVGPGRSRGFDDLWIERYQLAFIRIVASHNALIEGIFFSHVHRDEFVLLLDRMSSEMTNLATMFITSSVSPKSDNNPSFRLFTYDRDDMHLIDYKVFTLDILEVLLRAPKARWLPEYSFTTEYQTYGIAKADMLEFYQELSTDLHVFSLWLANWGQRSYFVNYDKHDEDEFLCLMTTVTNTQYAACMQMSPSA